MKKKITVIVTLVSFLMPWQHAAAQGGGIGLKLKNLLKQAKTIGRTSAKTSVNKVSSASAQTKALVPVKQADILKTAVTVNPFTNKPFSAAQNYYLKKGVLERGSLVLKLPMYAHPDETGLIFHDDYGTVKAEVPAGVHNSPFGKEGAKLYVLQECFVNLERELLFWDIAKQITPRAFILDIPKIAAVTPNPHGINVDAKYTIRKGHHPWGISLRSLMGVENVPSKSLSFFKRAELTAEEELGIHMFLKELSARLAPHGEKVTEDMLAQVKFYQDKNGVLHLNFETFLSTPHYSPVPTSNLEIPLQELADTFTAALRVVFESVKGRIPEFNVKTQ